MRGGGPIRWLFLAATAALLALVPAAPAGAGEMVVKPDGRIVLLGEVEPGFGTIAQLNPDGSVDESYGKGGFILDRRLPTFQSLAVQPDGRVLAAALGDLQLARYLPDGSPDPSFGDRGVGGKLASGQPQVGYAPSAVVVRPDGSIVVGATRGAGGGSNEVWVRRYDGAGSLVETVGYMPTWEGVAGRSILNDLIEAPGGSLLGVGSVYGGSSQEEAFLARFLPGSGTGFDPSFAGGRGLSRPDLDGEHPRVPAIPEALVASGGKLLVAGRVNGTFLLARFERDGDLDPSFGSGGFVAPPIIGPVGNPLIYSDQAGSSASSLAVTDEGDVVLGGRTGEWGNWSHHKYIGAICAQCPQPMLARFEVDGDLDPGFGGGGLLRLQRPDGSVFNAEVEQVEVLADGKILVSGTEYRSSRGSTWPTAFVARLDPDGSYDPAFGAGGLVVPEFPCRRGDSARTTAERCFPELIPKARLDGLRQGRPTLFLRVRPSVRWAAIHELQVKLPRGLRLAPGFRSKSRLVALGRNAEKGRLGTYEKGDRRRWSHLRINHLGAARELRLRLRPGSLRLVGKAASRSPLVLQVDAKFIHKMRPKYIDEKRVVIG
jgi:uncharacterized delta-60 repeat protein